MIDMNEQEVEAVSGALGWLDMYALVDMAVDFGKEFWKSAKAAYEE